MKFINRNAKKKLEVAEKHPRRPAKANFGELIQMDASVHTWFGKQKYHLHAAIDDSTGAIVGATFEQEETLKGYYEISKQFLSKYGIPYEIMTDRRTVFIYKSLKEKCLKKDTTT